MRCKFRLGYVLPLALAVNLSGQSPPFLFSDTFARPDGAVANGWTSWRGTSIGDPSISIASDQLQTFGYPALAGGVFRSLNVTFPVSFSFDFRTNTSADGGWYIAVNGLVPSQGILTQAQVKLYQYAGTKNVHRVYWSTNGPVQDLSPGTSEPVANWRNYGPAQFAHIEGLINADLSAMLWINYNDGKQPSLVTASFGPVANPPGPSAGFVVLGNSNMTADPHWFQNFVIQSAGLPFGSIDTPPDRSTGISGAIGVTGWALSPIGVSNVGLWRDPIGNEPVAGNGLVFVLNATVVPGSRPDVAAIYPYDPNSSNGWGAQILTNTMPNANGAAGYGNGTYRVHVIATDLTGQTRELGTRTFTTNNAQAVIPFGTIDTPAQGGIASGTAYVNFGWALTPVASNVIPKDGSTIWVYIDNQPVGHPVYNNPRSDIATLFPGLQNSGGPVGYYVIDTTKLSNGLHTIAWSVTDSAGNVQGIGSRFFIVQN